jgi:hypothetical protein
VNYCAWSRSCFGFVFVCDDQEEVWKIAGTVQRVRTGSQARQLVIEGMGIAEASLIMTKLRSAV